MAIKIIELLQFSNKMKTATVKLNGVKLPIRVCASASVKEGDEISHAEFDYEELVSINKMTDGKDRISSITYCQEGHKIRGKIINKIEINIESTLLDLYIQSGPEFITVDVSKTVGETFEIGNYAEVLVSGLCIYPVLN